MTGDIEDFVARMRAVLPTGWFADGAPLLGGVLSGVAAAWQAVWTLIGVVTSQTRIRTATGWFLDAISSDFFGGGLPRIGNEADAPFQTRILQELLRPRATRPALLLALSELTGRAPLVVEPARAADTGCYAGGGVGYAVAGAWGNLALSNACFVTAFRPAGQGIAELAGYGTGGVVVYGDLAAVATNVTDAQILACVARVVPVGSTAWVRIAD